MQEPAAPLKLIYFFAGDEFRPGETLTAGGVYLNSGDDGCKHLFKRRLAPLEALELASGSNIVCARLSALGSEADYADSLEVVSITAGFNLLFEFACQSVEHVFQRQIKFGEFKPSSASVAAVKARRLWIAGKISGAEFHRVQVQAAAVGAPGNGAMPGTPWWSFYDADSRAMVSVAECAAALVARSFTSNANFRQEVVTAVEKRVYRVAFLSQVAAAANGRAVAWKCRAERIGSPPASFWNDGMDHGLTDGEIISAYVRRVDTAGDIWKQEQALAQSAQEEMKAAQNKILTEVLQQMLVIPA